MVPTLPHAEMTASASPLLAQMASFTVRHSAWAFQHGRKSWVALRQEAPTQKHCQREGLAYGTVPRHLRPLDNCLKEAPCWAPPPAGYDQGADDAMALKFADASAGAKGKRREAGGS